MSSKHLSLGSEIPPKVPGKVRLYGMKFCPYVLRARLVLLAKKIPHDIVYVDLQEKPEWLWELNPKGKVPILEDVDSKIISESLDICHYLEKAYPQPALQGKTEAEKLWDKQFLEKVDEAITSFYKISVMKGSKKLDEILQEVLPTIKEFDNILSQKGNFFHGQEPGLVDYMAWPWVEKLPTLNLIFDENTTIPDDVTEHLRTWRQRMLNLTPVKETLLDVERHYKYTCLVKPAIHGVKVDDI